MKTLIMFFAVLAFAMPANATVPTHSASEEPVTLPPLGVECYCQDPVYAEMPNHALYRLPA